MNIIEFETRYRSYEWMNRKFNLGRDKNMFFELVKIWDWWWLKWSITETNPDELKDYTIQTYTKFKSEYIYNVASNIKIWELSLADYVNRLEYELKVIKEMGFYSYILIVQDFINWAKTHKIPVWPWRWSAAWSLLMYFVWIVDIDPMVFDLYFERFLNPARVSMPDVDIDFDDEWREKVLDYVSNKYGHENVSKIWTFGKMTAKAAFKDVARVFGIPFERANRLTNLMTITNDKKQIELRKCFEEIEELKAQYENDSWLQKTVEISEKLLNTIRQTGIHACGTLICPDKIPKFIPAQLAPNVTQYDPKERYVTQFDRGQPEDLWLLKMDFLWLANISIIKNTIKIIYATCKAKSQEIPNIFKTYFEDSGFFPDIYDQKVYETVFKKWNTTWIFQFESDGMQRRLMSLEPDRLEDLIAMTALYRPWPMDFIPSFVDRKHGRELIIYGNDELFGVLRKKYGEDELIKQKELMRNDMHPILEVTYGVAVYQEQLMRMSQSVAWFSLSKADDLRKAIGKKIVDKVKKIKEDFVKWAIDRWYVSESATWVYEKMIEPAALYSFNKSHAAAYSFISYQTAWLKTYYPIEFGAALLRSSENNTDDLAKFINELRWSGISVLAPNVNQSYTHVGAIDGKVRLWFLCIKWVWFEVSEYIQDERERDGKYKSLGDFLLRCQKVINKKSLEWLIKSGALSDFHNLNTLLNNIDYILEWTKLSAWWANTGWLFGSINEITLTESQAPDLMTRLKIEHEVFKEFVSGHPLDGIYSWVKSKYNLISQFKNTPDYGPFEIIWYIQRIQRAKKKWFFIKIEDISDSIEFFTKDTMDLAEFDIVYISGYRWRWSKRDKIVRMNLDDMVRFASNSGKYNPEETVVNIKAKRLIQAEAPKAIDIIPNINLSDNIDSEIIDNKPTEEENNSIEDIYSDSSEDNENDDNIYISEEWSDTNIINSHITNIKEENITKFTIPSDINIIKQIWTIVKSNPWSLEIELWTMKVKISDHWLVQIRSLLK